MKRTMSEFLAEVRKVALDPTLVSKFEANVAEALAEKATVKEEESMNKNIDKGFQLSEAIAIIKTEEKVNFLGMEIRKVDDKTFLFNGRVYQSPESVLSAAILVDSKKVVSRAASKFAVSFAAKAKEIAIAGKVYGGVATEATKDAAVSIGKKTVEESKKVAGAVGQKLVDFSK